MAVYDPMRFPVSFSQRHLWFLGQLMPGEPTCNMPLAIWLDGPLDPGALQQALDAMVARHAALRTSIVAVDGEPEQVVADTCALPVERIELPAALDDGERTAQAEAIASGRGRQPFDLATAPLLRATLVVAGPDRHLFVLVMHQIISDGASLEILIPELSAAYKAETTGAALSLPPLVMEYGDYAVWQRDRMRGEELDRQLEYWRAQLRGAPQVLTLPADRPRAARRSSTGGIAEVTIGAVTTKRLAAVAHDANATMFMVFLTGFAAVLSRYARETDFLIGTQVAGRTHTELEPILGMFTNTVPLRMSLAEDPSFAGLLGRVRDLTLDAVLHQQVPFEKLVEEIAPDRTLSHRPLIQVMFLYGALTPPDLDLPGITSRAQALLTGTPKLDITLYADPRDGQTTALTMEYGTDQFSQPWADQFLSCMATLLEHAADAPGTPLADLPMLTGTEHDVIIGRNRQALPAAPAVGHAGLDALSDDDLDDLLRAALDQRNRRRANGGGSDADVP